MARGSNRNYGMLIFFLFIGIVIGGFLGNMLGNLVPALKFGYDIGVSAHTWDFVIAQLTFGFKISLNMFTVLGVIIAIICYRRF